MEKTVNQSRLLDEIYRLIGQAQDGRFGDRQTAFEALEAVKDWAIYECDDYDCEPDKSVPLDGTKIRYNDKNIIIKGDKENLLKCVEQIKDIMGKNIAYYEVLMVDRWMVRYGLSHETIINATKECVSLNDSPRLSIEYIDVYLRRKHL